MLLRNKFRKTFVFTQTFFVKTLLRVNVHVHPQSQPQLIKNVWKFFNEPKTCIQSKQFFSKKIMFFFYGKTKFIHARWHTYFNQSPSSCNSKLRNFALYPANTRFGRKCLFRRMDMIRCAGAYIYRGAHLCLSRFPDWRSGAWTYLFDLRCAPSSSSRDRKMPGPPDPTRHTDYERAKMQ